MTDKLPFSIVTGFLGSGKTTVLSHWLQCRGFDRTAVIVNEFGQVGLDHRILNRIDEKTKLLGGGCVCCNIREDLVNELSRLLNEREQGRLDLDQVILETTGLADPAPILFSILTHPMLKHHYDIQKIITTLDAVNGAMHLTNNPESVKQLAVADHVILTKMDLASPEQAELLYPKITAINPAIQISEAICGQIDPCSIFSNTSALKHRVLPTLPSSGSLEKTHGATVQSISIRFYEPLDWTAFGIWLSMLLHTHGEKVYRVKGIIDVGAAGPVVLNGVQHIIHPPQHLKSWNFEKKRSEIVFIMKQIQPCEIMHSLRAFQGLIGTPPTIQEVNFSAIC